MRMGPPDCSTWQSLSTKEVVDDARAPDFLFEIVEVEQRELEARIVAKHVSLYDGVGRRPLDSRRKGVARLAVRFDDVSVHAWTSAVATDRAGEGIGDRESSDFAAVAEVDRMFGTAAQLGHTRTTAAAQYDMFVFDPELADVAPGRDQHDVAGSSRIDRRLDVCEVAGDVQHTCGGGSYQRRRRCQNRDAVEAPSHIQPTGQVASRSFNWPICARVYLSKLLSLVRYLGIAAIHPFIRTTGSPRSRPRRGRLPQWSGLTPAGSTFCFWILADAE